MEIKEKGIGSVQMNEQLKKRFALKIKKGVLSSDFLSDGSISERLLAEGSVTEAKIADGSITGQKLAPGVSDIITSLVMRDINKIWEKMREITGEQLQGLTFDVTPKYFISEEPVPVHISASSIGNNGSFDSIAFYINGVKIAEASGVDTYEFDTEISDTSEIKYEATILGTPYTDSTVVVHYNSFWLGAGATYQDVMDNSHLIPVTSGMKGSYNVTCNQADHIYIILSRSLRDQFVRADMNGFEIPFIEREVTIDDRQYCILESENIYVAGTYNIDINS